jgi:hypothetical protein
MMLSYRSLLSVQTTLHAFGKLSSHRTASLLLNLYPGDSGVQLRVRVLRTHPSPG